MYGSFSNYHTVDEKGARVRRGFSNDRSTIATKHAFRKQFKVAPSGYIPEFSNMTCKFTSYIRDDIPQFFLSIIFMNYLEHLQFYRPPEDGLECTNVNSLTPRELTSQHVF